MGICQDLIINDAEFMSKTLSNEITNGSKLRNKYLKSTCEEDRQRYKNESNLCVALYEERQKGTTTRP